MVFVFFVVVDGVYHIDGFDGFVYIEWSLWLWDESN